MFIPPAARRSDDGDLQLPVVQFAHPSGKTVTFTSTFKHESKRASDALVALVNGQETVHVPGLRQGRALTASEQAWWDNHQVRDAATAEFSKAHGLTPWSETVTQFTHAETHDVTVDRAVGKLKSHEFPAPGTAEFETSRRPVILATEVFPILAALRIDRLLGDRAFIRERAGYAVHQALTAVADVNMVWPVAILSNASKSLRAYGFTIVDVQWRTVIYMEDMNPGK